MITFKAMIKSLSRSNQYCIFPEMWRHKCQNKVNNTRSLTLTLLSTTCCGVLLIILVGVFRNPLNYHKSTVVYEPKPNQAVNHKNTSSLLDIKNFTYNITPKCKASKLIWIVTSYSGNDNKRSSLRRAYNSEDLELLGIQRIFLLGKLKVLPRMLNHLGERVESEALEFEDILQGNFFETFHHLTYKHVMGLKWVVENCKNASYIMKMDDDIIVNLYQILNKLENTDISNSIAGMIFNSSSRFDDSNGVLKKWYITRDEQTPEFYPQFVSGQLYLTTYSVASKLIGQAKPHSDFFLIDDIFVTGILRTESKIGLVDFSSMYTSQYNFLKCCLELGKKGTQCEFAVGPSNGDNEIQTRFKEYSYSCQSKCSFRSKNESFEKTCSNLGVF